MNEITEGGALNEIFSRRWGITGRSVFTMASDLFPVMSTDERTMDPELLYLGLSRRASAFQSFTPTVGQLAMVGIFSPPGGNSLVTVERIVARSSAPGGLDVRIQSPSLTAFSAQAAGTPWDSRWRTSVATGVPGVASVVAPAGRRLFVHNLETANLDRSIGELGIVLHPGSTLACFSTVVTATVEVQLFWRERRMAEWEKPSG